MAKQHTKPSGHHSEPQAAAGSSASGGSAESTTDTAARGSRAGSATDDWLAAEQNWLNGARSPRADIE